MRAVEARDLAAVERRQQLRHVLHDQVDQLALEGFLLGEGAALDDGLLRQLEVAPAALGLAANVGRGVRGDLLRHDLVHLPHPADRVRRADVRAGRHGDDVGGDGDQEAGRGRPGARGADEDGHGRLAVQDLVDDLPHRGVEAARRVEAQDHERRALGVGAVDGRDHVGRADRVDDPDQLDDRDVRRGGSRDERGSDHNDTAEKAATGPLRPSGEPNKRNAAQEAQRTRAGLAW